MNKKTAQLLLILLVTVCIFAYVVNIAQQPEDGWHTGLGSTQYYLDGQPLTGWQDIEGSRYYFNDSGILCTGWQTVGEETYYLGADGVMTTGWLDLDGNRYYLRTDGTLATGIEIIDHEAFFFGSDGAFSTGLVQKQGISYLHDDHGFIHPGWIEINGSLYYGDENGTPTYGWAKIDEKQYCFDSRGIAATGWVEMNGFTYYFYTDGAAAQGKLMIDGTLHHFASNGQLLLLVNPWNFVPENYTVELMPINETHQIAVIAYQAYENMMNDCIAAGFDPAVCSSYRTYEYQEKLFQNRIERYRKMGYTIEKSTELAGMSVAVPGTSEHQLGLALDIVDNDNWNLDESQAEMPAQQWLMENSWRYGWILRYPVEKSEFTGIIYEPWHYRYVGTAVAAEIHELNICLEEYLDILTNSVG